MDKVKGKEFAVKIIDLVGDKENDFQMEEVKLATKKEMNILRMCSDHPYISKDTCLLLVYVSV